MSPTALTLAYLDTNAIIRFVEGEGDLLDDLLARVQRSSLRLYTSEFTLAEVLVAPLRDERTELIDIYESILSVGGDLEVVPVDRDVLRESARVRATLGNRGPDAIHIATAIRCECTVFISSDLRLQLPEAMRRLSADDVGDIEAWI